MAGSPVPPENLPTPAPPQGPVQPGCTASLERGKCISSKPHLLGNLEDLRTHYFGCLRYDQRDSFWTDARNWDGPHGATGLADVAQPQIPWSRQAHSIEFVKYACALRVKGDLKRVSIVRSALANSPTRIVENVNSSGTVWRSTLVGSAPANGSPPTQLPVGSNRAPTAKTSAASRQFSVPFLGGKKAVENVIDQYRLEHPEAMSRTATQDLSNLAAMESVYNLKRDVKAQAIFMQPLQRSQVKQELAESDLRDALRGMMVPLQMEIHDEVYKGQFPDQHLSVEKLLDEEFIKLSTYYKSEKTDWKAQLGPESQVGPDRTDEHGGPREYGKNALRPDPNTIRYFHIASNNMVWVKAAMERYFGEEEAKMVLKDELWKGQEHGSFDENIAHSRYLRCLCERFSTDPMRSFLDESQHNMVLFMPYLHWDTDRNRSRMADVIEETTEGFEKRRREEIWEEKQDRSEQRPATGKWCTPCLPRVSHDDYMDYYPRTEAQQEEAVRDVRMARKIEDILWYKVREEWIRRRGAKLAQDPASARHFTRMELDLQLDMVGKHGRLEPKNPLARYLVDAARLFEAMHSFKDQKVLQTYLFPDPPVDGHHLHPRRTLDQSYFWKLKSTRRRDRDQVVYRHTLAEFPHRLHDDKHRLKLLPVAKPAPGLQSTNGGADLPPRNKGHDEGCQEKRQSTETWRWTGHTKYEDVHGCEQCTSDICKVARVVMVDQLWMWILDKNTILTCFPKRFGADVKDPSGVHYSIRRRLCDQTNPSNHVRSVFDLALIILDECFDTFFDRTKTLDKRPQVMDIFAESIGNIANKQAIALRHLQDLMRNLHRSISTSFDGDMVPPTLLTLLDVGRESELQQEIRDIIDELDMMSNVAEQQEKMVKRFIKIAEDILGSGRSADTGCHGDQGAQPSAFRKHIVDPDSHEEELAQLKVFKKRAADLRSDMNMRLKELEGLKQSAESTAMNVDNLLNLKQQQAGVVQAYQAVMQGRTTVKQGKAIMVFTVLTIIFLPMSFFTSLFGMNNIELQGGSSNSTSDSGGNSSSSDSSGASNSNTTTDASYDPPGLTPPLGGIANFQATTFLSQFVLMLVISVTLITFVLLVAFDNRIRRTCRLLWRFVVVLTRIAYNYIKLRLIANGKVCKVNGANAAVISKPYQFSELEDPKLGVRNGRLERYKRTRNRIVTAQHDKVRQWNEARDRLIASKGLG